MILFVDFDNTLIFSSKHNIGENKICIEKLNEKPISFMTEKSFDLLKKLNEKIKIVPVTTRSIEQFFRLDFGFQFENALVCNGGIFLKNGKIDEKWKIESFNLISKNCIELLKQAKNLLENEENRIFELRFIENLFLFTKCKNPVLVIEKLKSELGNEVGVFSNGEKIYVVPNNLSKGKGVKRFLKNNECSKTFSAGDSEFDISMLKETDFSFVSVGFCEKYKIDFQVQEMNREKIFSDAFLTEIFMHLPSSL